MSAEQQVVEHRHLREQLDVLERAGDAQGGDLVRAQTLDAAALPADVADLGDVHLADGVEDRGLAGAVGADDREQLAAVDAERDVVDRQHPAEAQLDVVELEQGQSVSASAAGSR